MYISQQGGGLGWAYADIKPVFKDAAELALPQSQEIRGREQLEQCARVRAIAHDLCVRRRTEVICLCGKDLFHVNLWRQELVKQILE